MIEVESGAPFTALLEGAPSGLVGTVGFSLLDLSNVAVIPRTTSGITELIAGSGTYRYSGTAPANTGTELASYAAVWDTGGSTPVYAVEELVVYPQSASEITSITPPEGAQDIRVMVPRVRRAIEGPIPAASPASDDVLKDVVADALSDVILLSGSAFGKQLLITATDAGVPIEYATSEALTLAEQAVVAAQAAVNFIFFKVVGQKTSERIRDEAGEWEWATSGNVLRDALKALTEARDRALEALTGNVALDGYVSFLAVRDVQVARAIEPWTDTAGAGGLELIDQRFGW